MTKAKKRTYYTLLERTPGQLWSPQFGDWDISVVRAERRDMMDSGSFIKGTGFKIIETDGKQSSISQAVDDENGVIVAKAPNEQVRKNLAKLERGGIMMEKPVAWRWRAKDPEFNQTWSYTEVDITDRGNWVVEPLYGPPRKAPEADLELRRIKGIYQSEGADSCLSLCRNFKKTKREMLLLLATFEK